MARPAAELTGQRQELIRLAHAHQAVFEDLIEHCQVWRHGRRSSGQVGQRRDEVGQVAVPLGTRRRRSGSGHAAAGIQKRSSTHRHLGQQSRPLPCGHPTGAHVAAIDIEVHRQSGVGQRLVTEQLAQAAEGRRGHAGVLQRRVRVLVRDGQRFADGRQRAHRPVEEPGEPHGAQRGRQADRQTGAAELTRKERRSKSALWAATTRPDSNAAR